MRQELAWMLRNAGRQSRGIPQSWRNNLTQWKKFWRSYRQYCQMTPVDARPLLEDLFPCLGDDTNETPIEPTYFYQDNWAFEKIIKVRPPHHVDVGSHHKFVALLSKVVPVTMVDTRPLSLKLDSLCFREGSILDLPFPDGSVVSASSLCVVEHIGLGRYGDPLDPDGSEKAIAELGRIMAPGAHLYFSVPIGDRNLTAFNAGRVFTMKYLQEIIKPLVISEQRFIVGDTYQDSYAPHGVFGTTGLFELIKP